MLSISLCGFRKILRVEIFIGDCERDYDYWYDYGKRD